MPALDPQTRSYIPRAGVQLPPLCALGAADAEAGGEAQPAPAQQQQQQQRYVDVPNDGQLIGRLQRETLRFALQRNFYVLVRIVTRKYTFGFLFILGGWEAKRHH